MGDVGQNAYEEINRVEPGGNYGWKIMEGPECFLADSCDQEGLELPVAWYPTYDEGCAVVGGYVYKGYQVSALRGHYIYGDWCSGRLFALDPTGEPPWEAERLIESSGDHMFASFGQDERGELYMLDHLGGGIYRFAENDPYFPESTPTPDGASTPTPPAESAPDGTPTSTPDATSAPGARSQRLQAL